MIRLNGYESGRTSHLSPGIVQHSTDRWDAVSLFFSCPAPLSSSRETGIFKARLSAVQHAWVWSHSRSLQHCKAAVSVAGIQRHLSYKRKYSNPAIFFYYFLAWLTKLISLLDPSWDDDLNKKKCTLILDLNLYPLTRMYCLNSLACQAF